MHIGGVLKKELLRDIVFKSIELGTAYSKRSLASATGTKAVVGIKHDGHIEYLRNMYNYYRSNLNLLDEDVYDERNTTDDIDEGERRTIHLLRQRREVNPSRLGCNIEGKSSTPSSSVA